MASGLATEEVDAIAVDWYKSRDRGNGAEYVMHDVL